MIIQVAFCHQTNAGIVPWIGAFMSILMLFMSYKHVIVVFLIAPRIIVNMIELGCAM